MTNDWIFSLESKIFSIVKAKTETDIKKSFSKVTYVTSEESLSSTSTFPTIYIGQMEGGVEVGKDLEGETINGVSTTFVVKVLTNTSKNDAKTIMMYLLDAFKTLGFDNIALPYTSSLDGVYTNVARFRRVIGASDKL